MDSDVKRIRRLVNNFFGAWQDLGIEIEDYMSGWLDVCNEQIKDRVFF
jgi:hypothetical protein